MIRKSLAAFLLLLFMASGFSALFIAPQETRAQSIGGAVAGAAGAGIAQCLISQAIGGLLSSGAGAITSVPVFDAANLQQNSVAAGSTLESCIFNTILVPIARAIARAILQQMTASVINWINGSNGTGQPSYIQNLAVHLQSVGDSIAVPYINQISVAFNSPFGSAVAAALSNNYAQQTSVQGFYAQNQCTLNQSSPNVNAYLAGNWSQGGTGAWFALTTEPQNNPYTLYQASQVQLGNSINQAQANRRQDLTQSGGYLSWCGPNQVGPGRPDACTNPDGSLAAALTPGSIVSRYANKTIVDSGIDQLISVNDLDSALGAIITALVNQVLGVGQNTGLYGASTASVNTARPAITTQFQNYAANNSTAAASANSVAQGALANATAYITARQTILGAANNAQSNVTSLISFCTTAANTATASGDPTLTAWASTTVNPLISSAQSALASGVNPVIVQANNSITSATQTQAFANQVQQEANQATSITTASANAATTLLADTQRLAAMPPSTADVSLAQQNAQATGGAQASPSGSLSVSRGTLIDQMNLISANASSLRSTCVPPP